MEPAVATVSDSQTQKDWVILTEATKPTMVGHVERATTSWLWAKYDEPSQF